MTLFPGTKSRENPAKFRKRYREKSGRPKRIKNHGKKISRVPRPRIRWANDPIERGQGEGLGGRIEARTVLGRRGSERRRLVTEEWTKGRGEESAEETGGDEKDAPAWNA
jgi:hypothetical protein